MNNESVVERLNRGIAYFQENIYASNAEMYRRAAMMPQRPHALIISCADSRVDLQSITNSRPGDLFVTRNVGNMVPPSEDMGSGVSAVIEYALTALQVRHVVVCGHSDCGAMKALLSPGSGEQMATVKTWLTNGYPALRAAERLCHGNASAEQRLACLTEENVLAQLTHLKGYPCVARALAREELTVSGWVYEIGTGQISIAECGIPPFLPAVRRLT